VDGSLPDQLWFTKGKTSGFDVQLQGIPLLPWNGAEWTLQLFPSVLGKVDTTVSCDILILQPVTVIQDVFPLIPPL